jgi:hypothetical protein
MSRHHRDRDAVAILERTSAGETREIDTHQETYDAAIDEGRVAAWHDADRGVAALARVCGAADDAASRARAFGFVTGVSMVWESVTLLDFVTTDTLPTLGTIDDAYASVSTRKESDHA